MARNDRILLDGIVDDRVAIKLPSDKRDEAFEYLAFEQILKDFDLSKDELLAGSIDGRQDGGIDGFFILVNGHLLQDPESFVWPRTGSDLRVFLISCKHHDTFRQATLDNLVASLSELLDFSVDDGHLKGAYSSSIIKMRRNLRFAYRKLSPRLARFSIDIYYASRGDTASIGDEVRSRAGQLKALASDYFGTSNSSCSFIGSSELVELHRRIANYTLELPFVEALSRGERYVVLAQISDYYKFISEDDKLRRYLFDSNVRDFMGLNRVNEDIKWTLENPSSSDFWWLNNGVTILATSATITGKSIQVEDVQIVNGLQTSESVFRHFEQSSYKPDDRCILVKVIVTKDEAVRDAIIRATNNQTDVELASLHATDKIQRDIEDVMLRHGLYYERRKNYYANLGHVPAEIVAPLYIAAGFITLILKLPHRSPALRSKFMRSVDAYEKVFSDKVPLEVWPRIAEILRKTDAGLEKLRPTSGNTDKFLKGWRYITAFILVSEALGTFDFSANDLVSFDTALITDQSVADVFMELSGTIGISEQTRAWVSRKFVVDACVKMAGSRNISKVESVNNRPDDIQDPAGNQRTPPFHITEEFLNRVRASLPPQPWKPGLHKKISRELKCSVSTYFAAVNRLIDDGVLYRQRDGVLYDEQGNVVAFDSDRVDPETLELRNGEV